MYTHKTVFLKQAVDFLASAQSLNKKDIKPVAKPLFMDATIGGGGHTREILERIPNCRVLATDWDHKAVENANKTLVPEFPGRLVVIHSNFVDFFKIEEKFRTFTDWIKNNKPFEFNGILADFGTSQNQILNDDGFSFNLETPLDMRMSKTFNKLQAMDIIAQSDEHELFRIFSVYGEEPFSRMIAKQIVFERKKKHIGTTKQLADIIYKIAAGKTGRVHFKTHPATRVFQALRIAVNDELKNIDLFVKQASDRLVPGGRLACITFHSLEDRIVKNAFKEFAVGDNTFNIITKKPIESTDFEIKMNKSCRSAKLRVLEKHCF